MVLRYRLDNHLPFLFKGRALNEARLTPCHQSLIVFKRSLLDAGTYSGGDRFFRKNNCCGCDTARLESLFSRDGQLFPLANATIEYLS